MNRVVLLVLDEGDWEQYSESYLITTRHTEEELEEKIKGVYTWTSADDHDSIIKKLVERDIIQILKVEEYHIEYT